MPPPALPDEAGVEEAVETVIDTVQVSTRVEGIIISEDEVVEAMQSRGGGAKVMSVAITQEVTIPLRELPGAAADYIEDPACIPCKVRRFQLMKGAADVARVAIANVKLLSIGRRLLVDSTRRRLGVSAEISVESDVGQDLVGQSGLTTSASFSVALQQAAASISAEDIASELGLSEVETQSSIISQAELDQIVPSADLSVASSFTLVMAPADDGDLATLQSSLGAGGTLISTALQVDASAVEVTSAPAVGQTTTFTCPDGTEEQSGPGGTRCVAPAQPPETMPSTSDATGANLVVSSTDTLLLIAVTALGASTAMVALIAGCCICKLRSELQEVQRTKSEVDGELEILKRQSSSESRQPSPAPRMPSSTPPRSRPTDVESGSSRPPSPPSAGKQAPGSARRASPVRRAKGGRPASPPAATLRNATKTVQASARMRMATKAMGSTPPRARPPSPETSSGGRTPVSKLARAVKHV